MKIAATSRTLSGKQVKNMRLEGVLPAVVYGPKFESTSVTLDYSEFAKLYKKVGQSRLFEVEVEGKNNKAIVKEIQIDPVKRKFKHVSIYAVAMDKMIEAEVPVILEGLAPAVKNNLGFLEVPMNNIPVKCLPGDLPSEIRVNVDALANVGDGVSLEDLKLGEGVSFGSGLDNTFRVAFIAAPQKIVEEAEVVVAAEGEAAEGEAAAADTAAAKDEE